MRMRRIYSAIGLLALLAVLVMTGCRAGKTGPVTSGIIRIAYNNVVDYPHYKALAWAAEEIEKQTDGRFTVKIYPNGTLGDQRAALELTQNNAVQMCVANSTIVESYNGDFAVLGMPYLFQDNEHQRRAYTSDDLAGLFRSTAEHDFTIVAAYGSGTRNVFCEREVREPADLKGMKFRVMQSDNMIKMMNLMGGTGVPMSAAEQYSAIQQGVVDGAEGSEIDYVRQKFYEVAPVYSRTAHCTSTEFIAASTTFMDSLPEKDRAIIESVMKESADQEFDFLNQMIDESIAQAEKMAVTFIEDANKEQFAENFVEFQQSIANESAMTKRVYDAIVALREEE